MRIGQIGQQCEMDIWIMVSQESHFQVLHQLPHLFVAQEQARDCDQSDAAIRNPFREVEFGENFRRQQGCDQVIHQLYRALRTRQNHNQHRKQNEWKCIVGVGEEYDHHRHDGQRQKLYAQQITYIGMFAQQALNPLAEGGTEAHSPMEKRCSIVQNVITDVRFSQSDARFVAGLPSGLLGQSHCGLRNLQFFKIGVLCDIGYPVPVELAAFEIHSAVGVSRILPQHAIDHHERLDGGLPGGLSNLSQTAQANTQTLRGISGVAKKALAAHRDSLQKNQLKRGDTRPKLAQLQGRGLLEPFHEQSEVPFAELIGNGVKKSLRKSQHSRDRLVIRGANMRDRCSGFQRSDHTLEFRIQQSVVVVQPTEIVGNRRIWDGQFESGKYRLQVMYERTATLSKCSRRRSVWQPR